MIMDCPAVTTDARCIRLSVANTWQSSGLTAGRPERSVDPPHGRLLLADDALGVDLVQYRDAVTGPLRHLSRRHTALSQVDTTACRRL